MRISPTLFSAFLSIAASSAAMADEFNVKTLADAIAATRAQAQDLRLEWSADCSDSTTENPTQRMYMNCVQLMKRDEGWVLHDVLISRGVNGQLPKTAQKSILTAYNGESTLYVDRIPDERGLKSAVIVAGRDDQLVGGWTDFDGIVWGLGSQPNTVDKELLKPNWEFTLSAQNEQIDGLDCVHAIGKKKTESVQLDIWICPSRGFLPLVIRTTANGIVTMAHSTDLREVKKGIWYPQLVRAEHSEVKEPNIYSLTKISLDPLDKTLFSPAIPPSTHVTDRVSKLVFITPSNAKPVNPDQAEREFKAYLDKANAATQQGHGGLKQEQP